MYKTDYNINDLNSWGTMDEVLTASSNDSDGLIKMLEFDISLTSSVENAWIFEEKGYGMWVSAPKQVG